MPRYYNIPTTSRTSRYVPPPPIKEPTYYEEKQEEQRRDPPPPPPVDAPLGPGFLDFLNVQLATAETMYPGQGFLPTADQDYGYMGAQIDASIGPAMEYAEQFGLQNILGYPEAGGIDFFGGTGGAPADLPPILPPVPPPGDAYKMFKWSEGGYEAAGGAAPDWWQAFLPEEVTPETAYGAMLNAMIPYLSPEDQVRTAHSLYGMFDTEMSHYKPGKIPEVSTVTEDQARYLAERGRPVSGIWGGGRERETEPLSDQMRRYYMSSQRSKDAIRTLSNMREAMVQGNRWKLGPGYKWLQNILESTGARGAAGTTAQTRQDYLSMLSSVDPFLSQAGAGELQPFGPLGQMLSKPFFTAGALQPQTQGRFGRPNRRFF